LSKRPTKPPLGPNAIAFTPPGNLTDRQRFEKAIVRARELHPAIVVARMELGGRRIGWIQSTISLDYWIFQPLERGRYSNRTFDPYLPQILPSWAHEAKIAELWIQPIELRSKAEIARDRKEARQG
jgi:hypothetical protein